MTPPSLTHNDFTPWNASIIGDKPYVFDWEFAERDRPISNDEVRFLLADSCLHQRVPADRAEILAEGLRRALGIDAGQAATTHMLVYPVGQSLKYVESCKSGTDPLETWDGERESAELIDAVLGRRGR